LTHALLHVHSKREARIWKYKLRKWYRKYNSYINQRTYAIAPVAGKRKWHYTHARVRSAYRQLYKLRDDLLRSSYRPNPELPRTTNYLEAGINSQLRAVLRNHRGMSNEHQMKAVEAYLYSRTEAAKIAKDLKQKPPRKKD